MEAPEFQKGNKEEGYFSRRIEASSGIKVEGLEVAT